MICAKHIWKIAYNCVSKVEQNNNSQGGLMGQMGGMV